MCNFWLDIRAFEKQHGDRYVTADLESPLAKVKMDINQMPFADRPDLLVEKRIPSERSRYVVLLFLFSGVQCGYLH